MADEEVVSTMTQVISVLEEEGAEPWTDARGRTGRVSWKVSATYLPALKVLYVETLMTGPGGGATASIVASRAAAVRLAVAAADEAKAAARKAADEAQAKGASR